MQQSKLTMINYLGAWWIEKFSASLLFGLQIQGRDTNYVNGKKCVGQQVILIQNILFERQEELFGIFHHLLLQFPKLTSH